MANFYSLYNSFEEMYDTMFRGNEIEFVYKQKRYCLLPHFNDNEIVGVIFGEFGNEKTVFLSKQELYHLKIEDDSFCNILSKIDIIWHNL